jgi:hypothetical protein
MSFQKTRDAAKAGVGLVQPSAPIATAAPNESPAAPVAPAAVAPAPAPAPAPVETASPLFGKGQFTRDSAPSKPERKEAASRRGTLPKDLPRDVPAAPHPPRAVEPPAPKAAPPPPTKPNDDFGI